MQSPLILPPAHPGTRLPHNAGLNLPATEADLSQFLTNRFVSRQCTDAAGNNLSAENVLYTLTAGELLEAFHQVAAAAASLSPAGTVATVTADGHEEPLPDVPPLAETLTTLFRESGAVNYLEIGVDTNDTQMGDLLLTLQRKNGNTPHQLRVKAEAKLAEAAIAAAALPTRDEVMLGWLNEFETGLSEMVSNMSTGWDAAGDVSYVEMELAIPDPEIGRLVVCVRRMGAKSPHALYLETRAALAEAREARLRMPAYVHTDDMAIDRFAIAMKASLAKARGKGRSDWENPRRCSIEWLQMLLVQHLQKGDLLDVAKFCMMLHQRGAPRLQIQASIDETPPSPQRPT